MRVERLPPVDAELIDALAYYRAVEFRLGERLLQEFEAVIQRLVQFPHGSREISQNLRQCALKVFPYVVIYTVREDRIIVVAFANTHRRPDYWRDRLTSQ